MQLCVALVIIWQARAVAWCACCDCCNGDNHPSCPSTTRTGVANINGGSSPGACWPACPSWGNYVALNGGCRWILPTFTRGCLSASTRETVHIHSGIDHVRVSVTRRPVRRMTPPPLWMCVGAVPSDLDCKGCDNVHRVYLRSAQRFALPWCCSMPTSIKLMDCICTGGMTCTCTRTQMRVSAGARFCSSTVRCRFLELLRSTLHLPNTFPDACKRPSLGRYDGDDPGHRLLEQQSDPVGLRRRPVVRDYLLDDRHAAHVRRQGAGPRH